MKPIYGPFGAEAGAHAVVIRMTGPGDPLVPSVLGQQQKRQLLAGACEASSSRWAGTTSTSWAGWPNRRRRRRRPRRSPRSRPSAADPAGAGSWLIARQQRGQRRAADHFLRQEAAQGRGLGSGPRSRLCRARWSVPPHWCYPPQRAGPRRRTHPCRAAPRPAGRRPGPVSRPGRSRRRRWPPRRRSATRPRPAARSPPPGTGRDHRQQPACPAGPLTSRSRSQSALRPQSGPEGKTLASMTAIPLGVGRSARQPE